MAHEIIEKLKKVFNSEITTTFLNNITKPLGDKTQRGMVLCRQDNINCFLDNIILNSDIEDIYIEDLGNSNCINNLVVNDKRINLKTRSFTNYKISFDSYSYREGDEFNVERNLEKTLGKLKSFSYILILQIHRNKNYEDFKVKYNFYLAPTNKFYYNPKIFFKTINGFQGENWVIQSNKDFFFNIKKIDFGNPIYSYSYNC